MDSGFNQTKAVKTTFISKSCQLVLSKEYYNHSHLNIGDFRIFCRFNRLKVDRWITQVKIAAHH